MSPILASAVHAVPVSAGVLGWCGGTIGTAISWPQVWRLWHGRRHAGLSLSTGVLGLLTPIAWVTYGVVAHSFVQVVCNACVVLSTFLVLTGQLVLARPRARQWVPLFLAGSALIAAATAVGPRTVGSIATVATIAGILPQLLVLVRGRLARRLDASGVARGRWLLSVACNVCWLGYGFTAPDPVIAVCAVGVIVIATAILWLTSTSAPMAATLSGPLPSGCRAR